MGYTNKQIPTAKVIATLIALDNNGTTGAVTAQGAAQFDLQSLTDDNYHEGLLFIEAKTVNGQGGTPTSPGAATTYTVKYAFCADVIALADVPTVLQNIASSLVLTLPNSNSSAAAGTRYFQITDPLIHRGRYLYVWYDRDAFAANALVDVTVSLKRL